jgi:hypothetical protein
MCPLFRLLSFPPFLCRLQMKLDVLAKKIGYVGMFVAVSTFVVLLIIKGSGGKAASYVPWSTWVIEAFIYGVTIIVVAIPEVSGHLRCVAEAARRVAHLPISYFCVTLLTLNSGPSARCDNFAGVFNAKDAP